MSPDGVLRILQASDPGALASNPGGLAKELGWGSTSNPLEDLDHLRSVGISGSRGLIRAHPAALFLGGPKPVEELLSSTLLYAYHSSIRWGMLFGTDGGLLFNSHWLERGNWYRLPLENGLSLGRLAPVIEDLTPSGIIDGRLDSAAARLKEPDEFLKPVDDALVSRLDFWRAEAMRYAERAEGLDARLHTLFAQFFVLRRVEDKGLATTLPTLKSVLESSNPSDALSSLVLKASEIIGSDLFREEAALGVPEAVISGIIRDLYEPRHLPTPARYHFEWVDADILGSAYEKYLATVLRSTPAPAQLQLFGGQAIRESTPVSIRKEVGVYYTPQFLVEYLVERALNGLELGDDLSELPRAVDFSCGSGSFLVAYVDALIRRLRSVDPSANWGRAIVSSGRVVGVDIDERAVTLTRLALWIRFAEEPDPFPLPDLEGTVRKGDALDNATWEALETKYDIVLGNPPFVALPDKAIVDLSRFRSAKGRFDYSYLFVEAGLQRLEPGGILAMVVPNRLFRNRHAQAIRDVVTSLGLIESVVDFGSLEVFRDTSAYVGALVVRRVAESRSMDAEPARVVVVSDLGVAPRFLGARLLDADHASGTINTDNLKAFNARYPNAGEPWLFLSEERVTERLRLQESGPRLDEVASIVQGIRTGANDVFVLELLERDERSLVRARNGFGDVATIESELLRPCVFGSEMQRNRVTWPTRVLIYPHEHGRPMVQEEFQDRFPKGHQYLDRYHDALAARAGIRGTARSWFELVWPREEGWLASPKLLIRDLAPGPAFCVDLTGETFNVGGTAVIPQEELNLLALLGYLNSSIVEGWLRPSAPGFRGGFFKFEPRHISAIPIPSALIGRAELQEELRELVASLLDLPFEDPQADELEDAIERSLIEVFRTK
jgi:SAM-dependent methyltransferase